MAVLAAVGFSLCFMGLILTAALMLAKKRDEFQRNLLNQALLWGIGVTMTITIIWGCLQEFANARPLPPLRSSRPFSSSLLSRRLYFSASIELAMNNRLRILRAERNWSQADLAQRLEVSRQSVNAIETGKYDPSLPLAFKLARLFDTTIEQIFTDEQ